MTIRTLKIKIKTLAAEAAFIRREERKTKPQIEWKEEITQPSGIASRFQVGEYFELHRHRVEVVRATARESLLAYGYLRGRRYDQMERKCDQAPNWVAVLKVIQRFGAPSNLTLDGLNAWADTGAVS